MKTIDRTEVESVVPGVARDSSHYRRAGTNETQQPEQTKQDRADHDNPPRETEHETPNNQDQHDNEQRSHYQPDLTDEQRCEQIHTRYHWVSSYSMVIPSGTGWRRYVSVDPR